MSTPRLAPTAPAPAPESTLFNELLQTNSLEDKSSEEESLTEEENEQDKIHNDKIIARLHNKADLLCKKQRYADAIRTYKKILASQKKINARSYYIGETYQKIASCHLATSKADVAIQNLTVSFEYLNKQALDLNTETEAEEKLRTAEEKEITVRKVQTYFDYGLAYKIKGKPAKAIGYITEGLRLNKTLTQDENCARNVRGLKLLEDCNSDLQKSLENSNNDPQIAPPLPLVKVRSTSDKENTARGNSSVMEILTAQEHSRSPLIESSMFNNSKEFQLGNSRATVKQPEKPSII